LFDSVCLSVRLWNVCPPRFLHPLKKRWLGTGAIAVAYFAFRWLIRTRSLERITRHSRNFDQGGGCAAVR